MENDVIFTYANRVLVIDDESEILCFCQHLLEQAQFNVMAVTDPHEGMSILKQEHVDLLLADIAMLKVDGFQVIDLARHYQPDIVVVIMTSYGTIEMAVEALQRGADAMVLKPLTGAELAQSIRNALQKSRYRQDVIRLQTLRSLVASSGALVGEAEPHRLQDLLLETVLHYLQCTHAGLYRQQRGGFGSTQRHNFEEYPGIVRESNPILKLVVGRGDLSPEEVVDPTRSIAGRAAAWGIPVRVNTELQSGFAGRGVGSMLAAPISISPRDQEEAELFVLVAARNVGEAHFRESDLEMFTVLSRQAAVALENAQLHAELQACIQRLEESQQALIKAEKLAIAGRLTASIAHEINNPLQSVQNCLHLAGRKELPPGERRKYLNVAQAELERLVKTVQRMLDYYRPGILERQMVNMNVLIGRVLSLLEKQLVDRQIRVETRLDPHLPAIWAVADQIQQVLLNLILNAIEAMPTGGAITIQTGSVYEAGAPNSGGKKALKMVEVIVQDTGPGIDTSLRERLFEPFVSSKEGGTGLGLAISYGIIAAHGGSLDLICEKGEGACFRILLPTKSIGTGGAEQEV